MDNPLRVAVVGRGRVGTALAAALAAHHTVSRDAAAADVVLLCVPDDALADVAATLDLPPTTVLAHTSGRHGLGVLGRLPLRGAWHPVMTFVGDPVLDVPRLATATVGLTADDAARPVLERLAREVAGRPVDVADDARTTYHAGLAHGANHLVTLVAQSAELLAAAGVDDPRAALRPLLEAALDNALRMGDEALTGPVVRGDAETVGAHVSALDSGSCLQNSYLAMAEATLYRQWQAGRLDADQAQALQLAMTLAVLHQRQGVAR